MFCQLGAHIFELAKTPDSISHKEDFTFAEFSLMNQANRLQPTGRGLRSYTLGIFLHQTFCKVGDEITALRTSGRNFEVMPLLWGNGKLEGSFVIISIGTETRQTDDQGNIYAATLQIELKEYISDPAQKQVDAATKTAFATGTKKNVVGKKNTTGNKTATAVTAPLVGPCNQAITAARQRIILIKTSMYVHHSHKDAIIKNHPYFPTDEDDRLIAKEISSLKILTNQCQKLITDLYNNHGKCLEAVPSLNLVQECLDISLATVNLNSFYRESKAGWPKGIEEGAQTLTLWAQTVNRFVSSTQPIASQAITRQP